MVTWGDGYFGGDSSAVAGRLSSEVVSGVNDDILIGLAGSDRLLGAATTRR